MKWEKIRLEEICDINMGRTPSRDMPSYWNGTNPWVSISDLKGNVYISETKEYITDSAIRGANCKIVPKGTLLYSFKLSIGKVAITDIPLYTNEAIVALPIKDEKRVDIKYLFYAVQKIDLTGIGDKAVKGITLNKEKIRRLTVPLPPLHIQKQIADTLDKADALHRKDQQLLQKYDELAQSIFYDMFGDPVKNEKGWSVKNLDAVCRQITDGTHFSPPNVSKGVPYITAKHVKKSGLDFFGNPTYVSPESHRVIYERCRPVAGDILYIKDGATTGIAAINEYDFEFSMLSSLALIKPDGSKLNNYYLKYWLNDPAVKDLYIGEFMAGAAIKRFTLQKIKQFQINLPPIDLQRAFANRVVTLERLNVAQMTGAANSSLLFEKILSDSFK